MKCCNLRVLFLITNMSRYILLKNHGNLWLFNPVSLANTYTLYLFLSKNFKSCEDTF